MSNGGISAYKNGLSVLEQWSRKLEELSSEDLCYSENVGL